MLKLFLLATLLSISGAAFGCTCPFIPLHTESVREAKKIFVFRLISAEVKRVDTEWAGGWEVVGRIKIIDRIHGRRASFKEIRFSTHPCCGSRLDVGNYFVAFVSGNGPSFFANSGNVHDVGMIYDQNEVRGNIIDIRSGTKEFEQVFSRASRDRIEQSPVPPPCFKAGEAQAL